MPGGRVCVHLGWSWKIRDALEIFRDLIKVLLTWSGDDWQSSGEHQWSLNLKPCTALTQPQIAYTPSPSYPLGVHHSFPVHKSGPSSPGCAWKRTKETHTHISFFMLEYLPSCFNYLHSDFSIGTHASAGTNYIHSLHYTPANNTTKSQITKSTGM